MIVVSSMIEIAKATIRMYLKRHELRVLRKNVTLANATHIVVIVTRNDATRLPHLFQYYRNIGFDHFIVVDNLSTDSTSQFCVSQPDVTLYQSQGSYKDSRFGNDWINYILHKHCKDKWILYVDTDEYLIYPHIDSFNIKSLTSYLESGSRKSLFSIMIDMYSPKNVSDNICVEGADPVTVCNLFDADGYQYRYDQSTNTTWVKGGVRARLFFSDDVWNGPALNKTPLVQWQRWSMFLKSSHQLAPFSLNCSVSHQQGGAVTGALLHFKFLSSFSDKVLEETTRKQHTSEFSNYDRSVFDEEKQFLSSSTCLYTNWKSLAEHNLLQGENWIDDLK